jgi:hypothetical protein
MRSQPIKTETSTKVAYITIVISIGRDTLPPKRNGVAIPVRRNHVNAWNRVAAKQELLKATKRGEWNGLYPDGSERNPRISYRNAKSHRTPAVGDRSRRT